MDEPSSFKIEEMDGLVTFLQSIEWKDPWLLGLIFFHVIITLTTVLTRNHGNFQIVLFLVLLLLVYFSESINELASNNWNLFSRQQYFDSKGVFISLVFSAPILLNCMVLVASWLYQSSQLMAKLKRAQLQARQAKQHRNLDRRINNTCSDNVNRLQMRSNHNAESQDEDGVDKSIEGKILDATGMGRYKDD